MPWHRTDDLFGSNRKVTLARYLASQRGIPESHVLGLWLIAATLATQTDGVVLAYTIPDAARMGGVTGKRNAVQVTVSCLIESGLWHDSDSIAACDRCATAVGSTDAGALNPGDCYFHDWTKVNMFKRTAEDDLDRFRERRKKRLHADSDFCQAIVRRDRSMCRYCGVTVDFKDRRSATGGTYDHVDPMGWNDWENIVVACRKCNGDKKDRTPEEAGMPLLPVPAPYHSGSTPFLPRSRSGADSGSTATGTERPSRAHRARGGTGRNGSETGRKTDGADRGGPRSRTGPNDTDTNGEEPAA